MVMIGFTQAILHIELSNLLQVLMLGNFKLEARFLRLLASKETRYQNIYMLGFIQMENIEFTQDLKTDTFSTAWVNSTNGGVYAVNDLTIYSGGIYKNLTGNNTNTTPNVDTTNWSAIVGGSSVDVTGTEQFMGYQINGRDVYQKYVGGTSPTGFANLYLELNGVDTLLSVEGVIKRNNQPQWHSISQIGNDRDGHSGAVYQENDDIAMYAGALLADFQGQPFKIVLKYTK